MTEARCENCKFADFTSLGNDRTAGACHRFPPVASGDYHEFPFIRDIDWCGEHQPAPARQDGWK